MKNNFKMNPPDRNWRLPTSVAECRRHRRKVARHVSVWLPPPREFALKGRRTLIHWERPNPAVPSGREEIWDTNQTLTCLATIHCRAATSPHPRPGYNLAGFQHVLINACQSKAHKVEQTKTKSASTRPSPSECERSWHPGLDLTP
jgi:hypothetical protein